MLHPAIEPYVRSVREHPAPHPSTTDAAARRQAYRDLAERMRGNVAPVASAQDVSIDLGTRTLRARLYVPLEDEAKALVVFFHGGSFIVGDLDTHDALCRRLCADTKMRFLAVDYRLAPEYPFPEPLDDAVEVIRHVTKHRSLYANPDEQIILMGDSAGATLVTVAVAMTREENLGIAAQVLIYPTMGPEVVTESAHTFGTGYVLEIDHLRYDYRQYLADGVDHTDPRVTPLFNADLAGVAPAIVVVAECDPLRDEGVAYAGLLEHFGVAVELLEAQGMVHGFLRMGGTIPEALEIIDDLALHMHRLVEDAS